ncbi:hypothetical protein CC80DRAFT_544299 [Byssothecium circinans]|uniref:Uncharacterized protein n=1 Tax=Byssothecium circinans TaxID=147558 RepID=A0A6A5U8A3_9PLEO|nr:hypothetical protein CC80DRAFT_544299 [Byssothecium circinans]
MYLLPLLTLLSTTLANPLFKHTRTPANQTSTPTYLTDLSTLSNFYPTPTSLSIPRPAPISPLEKDHRESTKKDRETEKGMEKRKKLCLKEQDNFAKGPPLSLDLCKEEGYGDCHHFQAGNAECVDLVKDLGNGWTGNDFASSLRPAKGTTCTFFRNIGCDPKDKQFHTEHGYCRLKDTGRLEGFNFDKGISSFKCFTLLSKRAAEKRDVVEKRVDERTLGVAVFCNTPNKPLRNCLPPVDALNKCVSLKNIADNHANAVSTSKGSACAVYVDQSCKGKKMLFNGPRYNLQALGFGNSISSVRCWDFRYGEYPPDLNRRGW